MSSIPRHFALKSVSNDSYLRYITPEDNQDLHGFLQYSGELVSPYTKLEVEKAKIGKGYVHIRCCYNNKYWVLHSQSNQYIVATAREREEDRSKVSCTLFKPVYDEDSKAFRFRHVHLDRYLHMQEAFGPHQHCLEVKESGAEETQPADFSLVVNWDTLFILPKYVAFKSNNNHYLRPSHRYQSETIANEFKGSDRADPGVRHEVITTRDGYVGIKNVPYGKFFIKEDEGEDDWIVLDNNSDKTATDDPRTLFWPIRLDHNVVALRNKANNCFCKTLTTGGWDNQLSASLDYISDEAKLEIIELVLSRNIYNVQFHLSDSRTYNENPIVMASTTVENNSSEAQKFSIKLSYEDTTTSTWSANVNAMVGIKMTIETGVLKVLEGEVEVSAQLSEEYTWGKTKQFKYLAEVVHEVTVPPETKVKGSVLATQASCDVPFSYTQRDKLMSGKYVTQRHHDGVYTVENSYNFHFLAEEI